MIKAVIFDQTVGRKGECEKLYAEHKLPCTFKMTNSAPDGLQNLLVQILVYD